MYGPAMGSIDPSSTSLRQITPDWTMLSSGIEKTPKKKPPRVPELDPSKTLSVPGERLRPSASSSSLFEPRPWESFRRETADNMQPLGIDAHLSESRVESLVPKPLPRLLPDKLDWAHLAYQRLWMKGDDYPFGGSSTPLSSSTSEDMGVSSKSFGALSSSAGMTASRSLPTLSNTSSYASFASTRSRNRAYTPHLELSSRGPRDQHEAKRGPWQHDKLKYNPRPPSSLAISRLPNAATMKGKHAFMGKE